MRAAAALFVALVLRHAALHKSRTLLTVASVAIGVAVLIAVRIANQSAVASFSDAATTVAGGTALQIVSNGNGLPERTLLAIQKLTGVRSVSPTITGSVSDLRLQAAYDLVGLDMIAALGLASSNAAPSLDAGRAHISPNIFRRLQIVISASLARKLKLGLGSQITLLAGAQRIRFMVGGIIDDEALPLGARQAIFCDLSTAQYALHKLGRLDRIDIIPSGDPMRLRGQLSAVLPKNVSISTPSERIDQLAKMVAAFQFNLTALAAIALVVGAYLVFNAVSMSVVQRRAEIAVLRAVGTKRSTILAIFLLEGAAVGVAGSIAGILFGSILASSALHVVSSTINALYVDTKGESIVTSPTVYALAMILGVALSMAASLIPALDAAGSPPAMVARIGSWEAARPIPLGRLALVGAIALACAGWVSRLPALGGRPAFGYLAALLTIFAFSLWAPLLVLAVSATSSSIFNRAGPALRLAVQNLRARVRRNAVAVASLMIGVAMTVSVVTMISSFRQSVGVWIDHVIRGDLYVRPGGGANQGDAVMPSALIPSLRSLPGVAAVDGARSRLVTYAGRLTYVSASDMRVASRYGGLPLLSRGAWRSVALSLVGRRRLVVSEPFANKFGVRSGDTIALDTAAGPQLFEVMGIYEDYSSDLGVALMDIGQYETLFGDHNVNGIAVYAYRGTDLGVLRERLRRALLPQPSAITTNTELRAGALAQFDRTFAVTYALDAIALTVALMGVIATLAALVIERRMEIGVLRCLGMTARQVRAMVVAEASLLGALGAILGTLAGYALALILVFVINRQAFGWTIGFRATPLYDAGLFGAVVITAAIAGIMPAYAAAARPIAEAVRAE